MAKDNDELTPEEFEERMENCYFATTFWNEAGMQYATETLGTDRMVLGTDYPIREGILRDTVEAIRSLNVGEEEHEQILHENVASLFD